MRSGEVTIAMVQAPQSQMAEAIRELRTSLRVILDDAPCPLITLTSPEPGDGKTFVAANLAAAWAMSGSKVIVVSADFRRPRIEEIFGLPLGGHPGLADLIRSNWKTPEPSRRPSDLRATAGSPLRGYDRFPGNSGPERGRHTAGPSPETDPSSVAAHLVDSGIWGLQILPAGIQLDNPSELFGSPGMQPVIDQLRLLADVVLIDTPPVLVVPDTAIIGSVHPGCRGGGGRGKDRPRRARAHRPASGVDQLPGARGRPQPGAARLGQFVPGLRLQAMTGGAMVRGRAASTLACGSYPVPTRLPEAGTR